MRSAEIDDFVTFDSKSDVLKMDAVFNSQISNKGQYHNNTPNTSV